MADNKTWIQEQRDNRLFRGGGKGSDASRLLEWSKTNRILGVNQARKITSARYINDMLGITAISEFCDMIEQAQLCVDGQSRTQFMKVAIEQWQGKVQAGRKFSIESMV